MDSTERLVFIFFLSLVGALILYLNIRYLITLRRHHVSRAHILIASGPSAAVVFMATSLPLGLVFRDLSVPIVIMGVLCALYGSITTRYPQAAIDIAQQWGRIFSQGYDTPGLVYVKSIPTIILGIALVIYGVAASPIAPFYSTVLPALSGG